MGFTSRWIGTRSAKYNHKPTTQSIEHVSPPTGASKAQPPSLDKVFADLVLSAPNSQLTGPWAIKIESTSDAGRVFRWGKHCWEFVDTEDGKAIAGEWLDGFRPDKASEQKALALWNFAATRLRQASPLPMPGHNQLIPTLSGYLDIQPDGRIIILPPSPKYGVDYVIKAELGHGTNTGEYTPSPLPGNSLFAKYLNSSLPDLAIREVVQELCAQTLLPKNYNVAAWFVGRGANGKGVMMELVDALHQQSCRLQLNKLNESFGLEALIGSSVVLVDEVENARFNEEIFKTLISANGIDINRKNQKSIRSYRSRAKWIIASNNIPHIADRSDGVWRRIIIVPWETQINRADQIPDLERLIIEHELHIVLDWLLEGAIRIVQRGRMLTEDEMPAIIGQQKRILRSESDSVLGWIEEEGIHADPSVRTLKTSVYDAYTDWCVNLQRKPLGHEMFWKGMRQHLTYAECQVKKKRFVSISLKPKAAAPTTTPITPAIPPSYELLDLSEDEWF
jgi:P4 family phage/plasmid primase-like protien